VTQARYAGWWIFFVVCHGAQRAEKGDCQQKAEQSDKLGREFPHV
jgi:hypothetical protein